MKELIIKPQEYGIEEKKAAELIGNLPQIKSERDEMSKQYDVIVRSDIEDPETSRKARELRLLIRDNRTKGINVWHKTTKDFFLRGGQFVDAIRRKEIAVNERMENTLEEIEKHFEIMENKRLKALQLERVDMLSKYVEDAYDRDLSSMPDDVWEPYLASKKKEFDERIAAEKKAEQERIAKEKAEAEERERIRKENERLKKEAEERDKKAAEEQAKREAEEKARLQKEAEERKAREEKQRKEREAHGAALKKEREERQRIENEERVKREKLEAELKAKKEAEEKAKAEEEARIQAELAKGDKDKVNDLVNDLTSLKTKYSFKSAKNKKMYSDVSILIDKVLNHIAK